VVVGGVFDIFAFEPVDRAEAAESQRADLWVVLNPLSAWFPKDTVVGPILS